MRHPQSRPWSFLLLAFGALLLAGPSRAKCSDEEIFNGTCNEQSQPPTDKKEQKIDWIGGTTLPANGKAGGSGNGQQQEGSDSTGNGVTITPDPGNYPSGDPTTVKPSPKPAPQPSSDPNSGDVTPRPIPNQNGTAGANNTGGTQASQDAAQVQAMAAEHVHSTLSQKSLEDKLRPLMQAQAGPGDLPSANVSAASPIGWLATAGNAAAQPAAAPQLSAMLNQGNYAGAERALTDQILAHPDNALAYRYRGMVRRLEKDFTGALDDSSQALRLNPRDGWAHDVRAGALVDLHRYPEAVEEANRAVEINPGDAKAYYTRASAWKRLGRREERLADLKRAAELDPEFASAYNKALAAEEEDVNSTPLRGDKAAQPARNDGTIALYGTAGGGLLLILAGVGLMFLKSGNTITLTRPPMRSEDRAAPPPALEGFEIGRKLGEGGMGIVFEATDRTLRRKVALKEMREHIAADPRQRRRFLKEASTVASLRHPNIVEIHSAFESDGKLFLVFEYVNGEPLNVRLDRGGLRPGDALNLLKQIAKAIDYAHAKNVIHQDLKPGNIMVAPEGVKIMDFGIARKLDTKSPAALTTTSAEIVGTPFYMAPEQESGETVKQSDIFALGVCAYEIFSGRRPFETVPCLFQKMEGKYTPLTDIVPTLPKRVDQVLAKALAAKPIERYATAQDFVSALETALCEAVTA